ncbi:MAG: hypothetical protein ACRD8W_28530, partial [Nitrososphaeraceae archaeon]
RVQSPFFDVSLDEDNILDKPEYLIHCISDGYWLFFEPCIKSINLNTFGSCSSGATRIGIEYDLNCSPTL